MTLFAIQQQVHVMTGPGTSILKGLGRPQNEFFYMIPNLLALTVAIPLSRELSGSWNVIGLSVAVTLSTIVSGLGFIAYANRLIGVPWRHYRDRVVLPSLAPYLVGALLAIPTGRAIDGMNRWQGGELVEAVGFLYAAILVAIVEGLVFDSSERLWFHDIIRRQMTRIFSRV